MKLFKSDCFWTEQFALLGAIIIIGTFIILDLIHGL